MQTGDLAGATGLSRNLLRFDQQRALLRAGNGWRDQRSQVTSWR